MKSTRDVTLHLHNSQSVVAFTIIHHTGNFQKKIQFNQISSRTAHYQFSFVEIYYFKAFRFVKLAAHESYSPSKSYSCLLAQPDSCRAWVDFTEFYVSCTLLSYQTCLIGKKRCMRYKSPCTKLAIG